MSDRQLTTPDKAMRDTIRTLRDQVTKLQTQVRSLQQGITSNGPSQLLANGKLQIEVTSNGIEDGLFVTFRNTVSGSESTIELP